MEDRFDDDGGANHPTGPEPGSQDLTPEEISVLDQAAEDAARDDWYEWNEDDDFEEDDDPRECQAADCANGFNDDNGGLCPRCQGTGIEPDNA